MNILVACEVSQEITKRFFAQGHNVYSCDIQETKLLPERHINGDVLPIINGSCQFKTQDGKIHYIDSTWDLLIAHPPCTYLSNAGIKYFNFQKYGAKAVIRRALRQEAFEFFMKFVNCNAKHICIENPVGYISTHYRKPDQIIQPFYFGDPYQKRTCLWLFNLPKLQYTNIIEPEPPIIFKSGKRMPKWYNDACKIPAERLNIRSKTFPGIAEAITTQWNNL